MALRELGGKGKAAVAQRLRDELRAPAAPQARPLPAEPRMLPVVSDLLTVMLSAMDENRRHNNKMELSEAVPSAAPLGRPWAPAQTRAPGGAPDSHADGGDRRFVYPLPAGARPAGPDPEGARRAAFAEITAQVTAQDAAELSDPGCGEESAAAARSASLARPEADPEAWTLPLPSPRLRSWGAQ